MNSATTAAAEAKPTQRASKAPKKSTAAADATGGTIGELIKQKLGDKLAIGTDKKDDEKRDE